MRRMNQNGNYVELLEHGYLAGLSDLRIQKIFQAGEKDGAILMGALFSLNKSVDEIGSIIDTLAALFMDEQYETFHDTCQNIMEDAYHTELETFYMMIDYKSVSFLYELGLLSALFSMTEIFFVHQEKGVCTAYNGRSLEEITHDLLEADLEDVDKED